jgi:hypothetical protein
VEGISGLVAVISLSLAPAFRQVITMLVIDLQTVCENGCHLITALKCGANEISHQTLGA